MNNIIVAIILVLAILISGCVGVDGEPVTLRSQDEVDASFFNGCMASIFFLTSPEQRPPVDIAIQACREVRKRFDVMEAQQNTSAPAAQPTPCVGSCL